MSDYTRWGLACVVLAIVMALLDALEGGMTALPFMLCLLVAGAALIIAGKRRPASD